MVSNIRARSSEQKEARKEAILEAALKLFRKTSFSGFTMDALAKRLGVAKGTLYLYFRTKEELFLSLYERLLGEWFGLLDSRLKPATAWDAARLARALRETLEEKPDLTRMQGLVEGILEHNIALERAREYKHWLLQRAGRAGRLIEEKLGYLAPGDGLRVLIYTQALVSGLRQMASPAPVMVKLLKEPEFHALKAEFGPALERGLEALLRGLKPRVTVPAQAG